MPADRRRTKLKPPLPPPAPNAGLLSQAPNKVLQGQSTRRQDSTHAWAGHARTSLFITRRTSLGALIARARSLVLDEGATELKLFALGAAISHAFVLLYALLDILPYPLAQGGRAGMWFEVRTGTVQCQDVVRGRVSGLFDEDVGAGEGKREGGEGGKADGGEVAPGEEDWGDFGLCVEDEPSVEVRNKVSYRTLHVADKGSLPLRSCCIFLAEHLRRARRRRLGLPLRNAALPGMPERGAGWTSIRRMTKRRTRRHS